MATVLSTSHSPGASAKRKGSRLQRQETRNFYLFISPWLLGFLVFVLFPIVFSLYLSFTQYNIVTPPRWTGGVNYAELVQDPLFWKSLRNTVVYTLLHLPLALILALGLAMMVNRPLPGMALFRSIYYLPSIIPIVATSLMWMWIFNLRWGVLNILLRSVGLKAIPWLGSELWAKPALVLMSLWWVGTNMVIYLASLQDVPQSLYEAAEVDGATAWTKFWRITLPMISPTILFTVIMGVIGSFQVFAQAHIMTEGGPQDATLFMVLYLYNSAFRWLQMGYASTLAWALFLIILTLTVVILRLSSRQVYYEFDQKP
ncbi:MAG: sugar ABC transporter permease [Caldilineaceae bacterium]|nr:sugar ABC transporter permease [Caldilineaceae bacterium]